MNSSKRVLIVFVAICSVRVSQVAARTLPKSPGMRSPPPTSPRQPVFYAVVQHDFVAERADELDAKSGDHISVVAQSNFEWFVAKPISRLGRPGLIPVSFVAIYDPSTSMPMTDHEVKAMMERGEVPNVDEWKRSILEYKATSISLGVLDDDSTARVPVSNSPFMPSAQQTPKMDTIIEPEPEPPKMKTPLPVLQSGIILSAEVLSWHFEMDEYWFRIHALFQADGSESLPPAKQLVLFRVYNDFYDFQVKLLNAFPLEAGQTTSSDSMVPKRILPYMPGPSQHVDDKVTQLRKDELDQYLSQLCGLWDHGAEYIMRDRLILDFFTPKAGDLEEDVEPAYRILEERRAAKQYTMSRDAEQIREPLSKMNVQENRYSDGSNYEEHSYASSSKSGIEGAGVSQKNMSNSSSDTRQQYREYDQRDMYPRSHSPYSNSSRAQSPSRLRSGSTTSTRKFTGEPSSRSMSTRDNHEQTVSYAALRKSEEDSPRSYTSNQTHPLSATGSVGSGKSRNRSASNANSPPISANNPNTAFVKIKIFDRLTQDLIAIRVSPRVTHAQLMDKVRARLGDDVGHLAYRNSISNMFLGLEDDQSLRQWLEGTDKHVLYAD
ncbi:hypothetical protein EW145_g72 [Phellinidium pouzarii]|uniref:SH3 domain-containing protein n=1 Tax=Phellinidium pouzarii TaxID=167371 RepID=A0A4S4LK17_9AGAM|nr:hypothetical protein EW145_g72 [Phellinidium pouzarii]